MGTSVYDKYAVDSTFGGKKVLNIGCGLAQFKRPNVVNVDAYPICNPDIVHDLEKMPLPFEDNTFDLIIANHILEHLHNWWACFEECARVLKPNGILEVNLPGEASDSQMGYRDHVSRINRHSFYGIFDCNRPASNAWAATNIPRYASRLSTVHMIQVLAPEMRWLDRAPGFIQNFFVTHLRNVVLEQRYKFRKMTEEEYQKRSVVYDFNSGKPV